VIIVGSQAILLTWPDAPVVMKITPEIDIYPENNRDWEAQSRLRGIGRDQRALR